MPVKKRRRFRNPKTTTAGVAALVLAALAIVNEPAKLQEPETLAAIAAGVGSILAADGEKKQTPPPQ